MVVPGDEAYCEGEMADIDTDETGPDARREDWPKVLDWIEKQGQESLKSRMASADSISKEAQVTLTVLLAAIGGSASYAAKLAEPGAAALLPVSFAAICVYLVAVALTLVVSCMIFVPYPALAQSPKNLMLPQFSLDELREAELENLNDRIGEAVSINERRAKRLNGVRLATALTPVVFVLVLWTTKTMLHLAKPAGNGGSASASAASSTASATAGVDPIASSSKQASSPK